MTEILIRNITELDEGEIAGKPLVVTAQCKQAVGSAAQPRVLVAVSRRAMRRLWAAVPSVYLWVEPQDDMAVITHIGAIDFDLGALDGMILGGSS